MKPFRRARRWLLFWVAPLVMSGLTLHYAARGWWGVAALSGLAAVGQSYIIRLVWRERPPLG